MSLPATVQKAASHFWRSVPLKTKTETITTPVIKCYPMEVYWRYGSACILARKQYFIYLYAHWTEFSLHTQSNSAILARQNGFLELIGCRFRLQASHTSLTKLAVYLDSKFLFDLNSPDKELIISLHNTRNFINGTYNHI